MSLSILFGLNGSKLYLIYSARMFFFVSALFLVGLYREVKCFLPIIFVPTCSSRLIWSRYVAFSGANTAISHGWSVTGNLGGAKAAREHPMCHFNWHTGCLNYAKGSGSIGSVGLVYRAYWAYRAPRVKSTLRKRAKRSSSISLISLVYRANWVY
jgi:hypothetical protein